MIMATRCVAKGTARDALDAIAAARAAFPIWSRMKWQDRVRLLRKVVDLIEKRVYALAAANALDVGKNRLEALGDVQEAADLISYYCDAMERNKGFVLSMARDPLKGYQATNVSRLRPHGVWVVISPFNFPVALSAGPGRHRGRGIDWKPWRGRHHLHWLVRRGQAHMPDVELA